MALTGHLRLNWCEPERAVVSRSYEQPLEHVEPAGEVGDVHRGLKDLLVARSAWACSSVPPQRSREAGPSLLLSYAVAGVVIFLIMWAFRAARCLGDRAGPNAAAELTDMTRPVRSAITAATAAVLLLGCGGPNQHAPTAPQAASPTSVRPTAPSVSGSRPPTTVASLPGMPPPLDPHDVYAADRPNALSPVVRQDRPLVYVPNTLSNTVSIIDPRSYRIIRTIPTGRLPQHVVPSYDLRTLWVNNNNGNTLTPINPRTGQAGRPVPVTDPYNLYFTPDGRYAVVMAERKNRIDFRDPHTMRLERSLPVPCSGVNHADFSADGRTFLVSCEFSGDLLLIDSTGRQVLGHLHLPGHAMPQDVKLSPDGRIYYIADMQSGGVWLLDAHSFHRSGFLRTGAGAHGLYVSRDSRYLYVTNRGEGSISLVAFATRRVVRTWHLPGGGSPDMGGVSADGRLLWLSGRYSREVYVIDVVHWRLLHRIRVGNGPHGLCVFPQPGRYSLGHTGIFR